MKKLFLFLAVLVPLLAEAAVVVVARPVVIARPVTVAPRPVTPAPAPKTYTPPVTHEVHPTPAPVYTPIFIPRSNTSCNPEKDKDCKK